MSKKKTTKTRTPGANAKVGVFCFRLKGQALKDYVTQTRTKDQPAGNLATEIITHWLAAAPYED